MSEVQHQSELLSWECSMCGHEGGPYEGCDLCHGNQRFRVPGKSFTLSEERQGKNPNANQRYGPDGQVGPKIVVLPGGYDPSQGTNIDKR